MSVFACDDQQGTKLMKMTDDLCMNAMEVELKPTEAETPRYPSDYDLADDGHLDNDFTSTHSAKRRRGDFTINTLGSRFGTRLPSFSRKWRHRQAGKTISIADSLEQPRTSRANSTRAPSRAGSIVEVTELQDSQLPPTPARSVSGYNPEDSPALPIDIQKANTPTEEFDAEGQTATTPLLPPIMTEFPPHLKEVPYQSPLQSPTVADPESAYSVHTPIMGPQVVGLPSPPLSAKPSMASFHRQRGLSMPPAEHSPMKADPSDQWANKLGHANFTINPEPYLPENFDVAACKRLRTDWDLARCNFMKHLMRTGENWGATSKTYKLTEEKWAEIDACWKRNSDLCISRTADNGYESALAMSQGSVAEPAPLMKLPSLNGPKSEGKFPKLGDEDIVGPLERAAQVTQPKTPKKSGFFKLFSIFGRRERTPSL